MNLSHYFKAMLFEPFPPDFRFLPCPTFTSMCIEMKRKSVKKSVKNQKISNSEIGS